MRGVIKEMYRVSRSAVLLDGECSEAQQGVAQGCSLSLILFINCLLKEVEQAGLRAELSDGSAIGGMLFTDDFVGVSNSEEELQRFINVAHAYCCKWRLKANVSSGFCQGVSRGMLELGRTSSPRLSKHTYLGVENSAWDEHVKRVLQNGSIVIGILT